MCPPTHHFQGVDCRVVLSVEAPAHVKHQRHYQCIDCHLRWIVESLPACGSRVVWVEGQEDDEHDDDGWAIDGE